MYKIELDINDDILQAISRVKETTDNEIDIIIPEGAVLLENILNLKLLNAEAEKLEKSLTFQTTDEAGQNLIAMLDEDSGINPFANYPPEEQEIPITKVNTAKRISLRERVPSFSLLNFSNINFTKKWLVLVPVLLLLGVFIISKVAQMPIASIGLVVNTQSFAKSIQLKVDKGVLSNAENKTLNGTPVSTLITETLSTPTTGQKTIGKKSTGKIKIYNRTDSDNTFDKGTTVTFEKNDKSYNYITDKGVSVAAATLQDPADPASASVPGSTEVNVTAAEVGDVYNIDNNETLSVKGEKSSQFTAKTTTKIEGGSSQIVKTVAQADLDKLTADMTKLITDKLATAFSSKLTADQKLIQGSAKASPTINQFSKKLNDEAETLDATASTTITGLVYLQSDLLKLVDKMTESFVPDGYKLSDQAKEIKTEVLGNTETTVLNSDRADIQVTVKALVVPNISEESIKEQLKGKSPEDASTTLAAIKNIKTYSINISPAIPLLRNIPVDEERIKVDIKIE